MLFLFYIAMIPASFVIIYRTGYLIIAGRGSMLNDSTRREIFAMSFLLAVVWPVGLGAMIGVGIGHGVGSLIQHINKDTIKTAVMWMER